jgi:diacylglycerol kinase family enzyme
MSRRLGAIAAVGGGALALAVSVYIFVSDFPRGLAVFVCVLAALAVAWLGLLRRGGRRILALAAAALLLGVAIGTTLSGDNGLALALVVAAFLLALGGARVAFRVERTLPSAAAPRHPVLFVNPWSGDGKAAKANLVEEARKRGIETRELERGDDLEQLVRDAVREGADGLAMGGGDGSQALVASIAAEHDLPYACIPSGTRNHFALDLGVDREDVVGALDAFVDGGERLVDLGEVNGRVFVNNVSLGVYAEAVSQDRYRAAKLRTLLDTLSGTLGPDGAATELRWRDPDGVERRSMALVLVSNNAYRLGPTLGSGTRPSLDAGLLGVVDFHPPAAGRDGDVASWRELTAPALEVEADGPVPVGVDGESLRLEPPLRFRSRPGALRVRIARDHPGASPSEALPSSLTDTLRSLLRIAARGDATNPPGG